MEWLEPYYYVVLLFFACFYDEAADRSIAGHDRGHDSNGSGSSNMLPVVSAAICSLVMAAALVVIRRRRARAQLSDKRNVQLEGHDEEERPAGGDEETAVDCGGAGDDAVTTSRDTNMLIALLKPYFARKSSWIPPNN